MQSDFSESAKRARDLLRVPDVPMEFIRKRAAAAHATEKVRRLFVSSALAVATIAAAAAFTPAIYDGVRLWISGNSVAVTVNSFVMTREPITADLRSLVSRATFPVIFPLGVPAGTHIARLMYAPAEHPNAIFVEYQNERANFRTGVAIFDSRAINAGDAFVPRVAGRLQDSYHWRLGGETLLILKRAITVGDAERIRSATTSATQASSLAGNEAMLSYATILGLAPSLSHIASRYAPRGAHSVVIGPGFVRTIPELARTGKPLTDSRTVLLTNIPSKNGEPDYQHAILHWPKSAAAVSPQGVRAIDAVLRVASPEHDCGCEIVFARTAPTTDAVWVIRHRPAMTAKRYEVDARTFAVKERP